MSFIRILPVFVLPFFIFSFSQSFAADTWEVTTPLVLGAPYNVVLAGGSLNPYITMSGDIITDYLPPSFTLDGLYGNIHNIPPSITLPVASYVCVPTKKNGVFLQKTTIQTFITNEDGARGVDEKTKNSLLKTGKINGVETPFLFIRGTREMTRAMRVDCISPQMDVVAGDTVIVRLHYPKKSTLTSSDLFPGKKRNITRLIADQISTANLYYSAINICQNKADHCDIQTVEITYLDGSKKDITADYKLGLLTSIGFPFTPDIATVRIVSVKK